MPFVVRGYGACEGNWGLSMDGLILGPLAPGKSAFLEPMMGKGLLWDSMVCTLLFG